VLSRTLALCRLHRTNALEPVVSPVSELPTIRQLDIDPIVPVDAQDFLGAVAERRSSEFATKPKRECAVFRPHAGLTTQSVAAYSLFG
jgi:hypothetical protein